MLRHFHIGRSLLAGAVTLAASASAVLAAPKQWGGYSYEDKGASVEIVGLTPYFTGHLQIPVAISGKPVTRLGLGAFKQQTLITKVTIPSRVSEIGPEAFEQCTSLTDVVISGDSFEPSLLTSILGEAFRECHNLANIQLPSSLRFVDIGAFAGCSSLVSITLPAALTDIQPSALDGCWKLQNIHATGAGSNYNSVGGVLFKGTGTSHLVRFPQGRTGTYVMPSSVVRVGTGAFAGSRLTNVGFSAKLASIDYGAFSGARLASVALPSSLETISDAAFASCDLVTVHIPAGVKTIGGYAFSSCLKLASFTVATGNPLFSALDGCLYDKAGKVLLRCPHGKSEVLIRPGTTVIGPGAFRDHPDLRRVSIPEGVTEIQSEAFYNCDDFVKVSIPASVTRIGYAAFYSYHLTEIHFAGNAPETDSTAFSFISDPVIHVYPGAQGFTFPYWISWECVSETEVSFPEPDIEIKTAGGSVLADGTSTLTLGSAVLGKSFATTLAVGNQGTDTLWGFTVSKSGSHSADFTLVPSGPLEPAQSAKWKLTFKPSAAGVRTATFRIASNDPDEAPFDLNVSATATSAPEIVVQQPKGSSLVDGTAKKSFGTATVGSAGRVLTFVIRNTGTEVLSGLTLATAGKHAADFQTSALAKKSLPPGASLTFKVTFFPKAKGNRSATLQIRSNDSDESPFDVKLAGTGAQ